VYVHLSFSISMLTCVQAASSNPHIAEERNQSIDDSGINEEDKYVTKNSIFNPVLIIS